MTLRWTSEPVGEAIVDIVLSLNEQTLKLHDTETASASYSSVKPSLRNFDEIGRKIDEVEKEIQGLAGHPGRYLRSMVNAYRYFGRSLQGDDLPYAEYIANIQELPATLIPEETMAGHRELVEKAWGSSAIKAACKKKRKAGSLRH
ncbi:hypothetical protein [Planococcus koreensis]|uniref:hypothetical protein n=1 Tax=Planococcus koreensis TaxID=112331 RepID=UPI0039FC76DD